MVEAVANGHYPDKKILEILSQERTRDILLLTIEIKILTQMEIYKKIGISQSSVSWHLQRLIALDIVQEIRQGKYRRYQIVGGSQECKRITHYQRLLSFYLEQLE
jgi:predicted transcriptional regulator